MDRFVAAIAAMCSTQVEALQDCLHREGVDASKCLKERDALARCTKTM